MQQNRHFPKFLRVAATNSNFKILPDIYEYIGNEPRYIRDNSMIRILAKVLNFNFELVQPLDGPYGSPLPDGNWTGIIGMVHREEADIAIGKLSITEQRSSVIDFSYPYQYIPISFITDQPQYLSDRYAVMRAYSLNGWIAIIASLILVQCASCIFQVNNKGSLQSMLLDIYGILLEMSINFRLHKLNTKFLIFSWIIGAMFLSQGYKAILLSFLTFPTLTGIRNIPELAKAAEDSSFKCSTYPGSSVYQTILGNGGESWQKIGECINRTNPASYEFRSFLKSSSYRKAFMGNQPYLQALYKSYFISDDAFFTDFFSIAVRKSFCCRHEINKAISKIACVGILEKLVKDEQFHQSLLETQESSHDNAGNKKLSMEDLFGAFLILYIGMTLSIVALIAEILVSRWKMRNMRRISSGVELVEVPLRRI